MSRSRFLQQPFAVALLSFSAACNFDIPLAPSTGSECSGFLSSCISYGNSPPAIQITPDAEIGLAVGESTRLAATYFDSSVPVSEVTFQWQSSEPNVAVVSDSGTVRAVAVGSARIVAFARGISDTVTVHVRPPGLVFTDLTVGDRACGIAAGGTAYCWLTSPIAVPGGRSFTTVSSGLSGHFCGLDAGQAYCWGQNGYGELGSTPGTASAVPTPVSGGIAFTMVGAGNAFSCGLTTNGSVYCWGVNAAGQLGTGSATGPTRCGALSCSPSPVLVAGGLIFRALTVGGDHACALLASGAAYCWGANWNGNLGNGTMTNSPRPVPVAGGRTYVSISAGDWHTCALTVDELTYCWGSNRLGRLGTTASLVERCPADVCSTQPILVAEGRRFTTVSAGGEISCGIESTGTAFCWGAYPKGSANYTDTPVPVAGGLRFRTVSAGKMIACGLTTSEVAYCWRTGDGVRADSIVPVKVRGQP